MKTQQELFEHETRYCELLDWIKEQYGGLIRVFQSGMEKHSEDGCAYCRKFMVGFCSLGKIGSIDWVSLEVIIRLQDDVWYVADAERLKKRVEIFVNKIISDMLK